MHREEEEADAWILMDIYLAGSKLKLNIFFLYVHWGFIFVVY